MKKDYDFKSIESKWQKIWDENKYGIADDFSKKPKHYHLVEFPYPSGAGLHVGHCMGYGASDAYCRMKRMQGFNVMHPIGWDAFGLPTENFAIKNKIKPAVATKNNVETFKKQMKSLGLAFDWSREVNTTDPEYYKWTQWIFLQFYKHAIVDGKLVEVADDDTVTPRLAFQAEMPVNWCPSCKVVLANEEVVAGNCERCGAQTEKRNQKQWMLRITAYADRLIKDLDTVEYLDKIKTQQVNWIGKSTGTNITFDVKSLSGTVSDEQIEVFTTRADTLFGCTYLVISPEHPLVNKLGHHIQNFDEIKEYIVKAKQKSDLERTELQKEKTGVKLYGIFAINPINNEEIPVYIADYVLSTYGTGAVMAVPAHDQRDFEFAKKYNIEIKEVITPKVIDKKNPPRENVETVFRRAIQAILINPKDGKVLTLKWKKFPWTTFITGGVEAGEDIVDSAKREIIEETGYKNIKYVRTLGGPVESHFHASHKSENRKALFSGLVFELTDEAHNEVSTKESEIHDACWMSWDEIAKDQTITCAEYEIWLDRFFNPEHAFTDYGILSNSDKFDGLTSAEAKSQITEKLKSIGKGDFTTNFKLRDWIFSRQHYWGEPIPIVHCDKCGVVTLPEDQLPLTLPEVENYEPTDNGESPLAKITDWVNTTCPKCGGPAKRETDTMPNWAGSSWYFLRYCDPKNKDQFASSDKLNYWTPIDIYNGGMEHTTLHLLYSRFWHKFLYDLKVVPTTEPYAKRIAHGIILGPDGRKMSKSFGNVINPDDIASQYGADTLRAYIMFIGPYDQESAWSTAGVQGVFRFLKRVWANAGQEKSAEDSKELLIKLNQTIAGVVDDIENFRFNTYIAKLMELNNTIEKVGKISPESYQNFLLLLYPAAPHIASELWQELGFGDSIEAQNWPKADSKYLIADEIEIVVQVNGKVRDKLMVSSDISDEELKKAVLNLDKIKQLVADKEIKKTIIIPRKLVSIVIE
jgi:leucyl-tRNA synthetase